MVVEVKNIKRWWEPKTPTKKVRDTPPFNKKGFWEKREHKVEIRDGEQTSK